MHKIELLEVSLAPGVVQYLGFRPDCMGMNGIWLGHPEEIR